MRARFPVLFGAVTLLLLLALGQMFTLLCQLQAGSSRGNARPGRLDEEPGTLENESPLPGAGRESGGRSGESQARALFRRLDRNGDGLLQGDEMTPALRAERHRWDANKDGAIDPAEFLAYFQDRVEQLQAGPGTAQAPLFRTEVPGRDTEAATGTDVLPAGSRALATDRDGPVSLAEWRAAGQTVVEFQRSDGDGDDFLTPGEVPPSLAQTIYSGQFSSSPNRQAGSGESGAASPSENGSVPRPREAGASVDGRRAGNALPGGGRGCFPPFCSDRTGQGRHPEPVRGFGRFPPSPPNAASGGRDLEAAPVAAPAPALALDALATTPLSLNEASNPYWMARNQENVQRLLLGGPANVLFLGDSITDWLTSGAGQPVWDTFFAPLDADNLAVAGITTSHVLWQVETGQVAFASPNVVVLMIGTNNLGMGQSPAAVAAGITRIVEDLRQQLPDTRILLLGILPRGQSPTDPLRQQIAQVNGQIAGLEDAGHVTFLDVGGWFLQPEGRISPFVMPDFLHPSLLGYQIYADAIWPTLMAMLP